MKKKFILGSLLAAFMTIVATIPAFAYDKAIHYSDVPGTVKTFLGAHLAGAQVKTVTVDADDATPEYEITFKNGISIDINAHGEWEEISTVNAPIPMSIFPEKVTNYLNAKYPGVKVVKAEQDTKGYEVKLANNTEIKFDRKGNFVKIDR